MTDNEINRALTSLAGDCWHELKPLFTNFADEMIHACKFCNKKFTERYGKKLSANVLYTESLDATFALAEKLGYYVDVTSWPDKDVVDVFTRTSNRVRVDSVIKDNRQRARRLALCEAILKAENKWMEKEFPVCEICGKQDWSVCSRASCDSELYCDECWVKPKEETDD
jgi:hypothetical protein